MSPNNPTHCRWQLPTTSGRLKVAAVTTALTETGHSRRVMDGQHRNAMLAQDLLVLLRE